MIWSDSFKTNAFFGVLSMRISYINFKGWNRNYSDKNIAAKHPGQIVKGRKTPLFDIPLNAGIPLYRTVPFCLDFGASQASDKKAIYFDGQVKKIGIDRLLNFREL